LLNHPIVSLITRRQVIYSGKDEALVITTWSRHWATVHGNRPKYMHIYRPALSKIDSTDAFLLKNFTMRSCVTVGVLAWEGMCLLPGHLQAAQPAVAYAS